MKLILQLLFVAIFLNTSPTPAQNNTETGYQIESGKIVYRFGGDYSGNEIFYFKNFGSIESHLTSIMPKQNKQLMKTKTIIKGDDVFEFDLMTNKTKYSNINKGLLNKTEEILTTGNFIKSGVRIIEGKVCDDYSSEIGAICVWKGIILNIEINISGKKLSKTALSIDTLSLVPDNVFNIN